MYAASAARGINGWTICADIRDWNGSLMNEYNEVKPNVSHQNAPPPFINCGQMMWPPQHVCDKELCNWLVEPFVSQELNEGSFEFVSVDYDPTTKRRRKNPQNLKVTTLICDECGKNFSRIDSLKRHVKLYCKTKSNQFVATS
ncbi:PREDICTED: uncharacterized protein LOC105570011 [Vollenhovia emeryi]|uniref:uncharacterized protein LOC105570011 n=1 Tax=Vollenhovia emeryi TaxID=411798 RepID=UPI0005F55B5C|nr:PREDICTED: uncharacterized protein LOC105570011 [Vollenhovia emeryi]